jgi:hypothetical protein
MDWYDVLYKAADNSGVTVSGIGRALGKAPSLVSAAKARGSYPLVTSAAAMLSACGYALVAIPASDVPSSALVIGAPPIPGDARKQALLRERDALARRLQRVQGELDNDAQDDD